MVLMAACFFPLEQSIMSRHLFFQFELRFPIDLTSDLSGQQLPFVFRARVAKQTDHGLIEHTYTDSRLERL